MKYHARRRHVAAIAPAEISASLPRQRQLAKDCTRRSQRQPQALDYVQSVKLRAAFASTLHSNSSSKPSGAIAMLALAVKGNRYEAE
jgi:hypothetical protein